MSLKTGHFMLHSVRANGSFFTALIVFFPGPTTTSTSAAEVVPEDSSSQPEVGTAETGEAPGAAGNTRTLWCLIEDARLVFGTTWIFLGVLVLQSSFSVKRLPCLVFHPGFQLFLFAIQHDDVTVTSKVECLVY